MVDDSKVKSSENDILNNGKSDEAEKEKSSEVKKKTRTDLNYPPYVTGYGAIPKLFSKIKAASVPPKFNYDFMKSVLEMRSSSHQALIPLLKKLEFLDQANVPTDAYRQYRDDSQSQKIMAQQLRKAYSKLYQANEYADKLNKGDLTAKLKALTGAADDDTTISAVVSTFLELKKLANFDWEQHENTPTEKKKIEPEQNLDTKAHSPKLRQTSLGISYTINLNLPATSEIEVFNAIFKSLKEHILYEE